MASHFDRPTVSGSIYYATAGSGRRYCYAYDPPSSMSETNVNFAEYTVAVRDTRSRIRPLRLDVEGATVVPFRSSIRSYDDIIEVTDRGYTEAEQLLRRTTGAAEVVVFDHNIRRGGDPAASRQRTEPKRPVFHAHTDFTADSAFVRASIVLGAERLRARRFMAVNLWRPIAGPVLESPLAICDASSVAESDLKKADLIYPNRTGEINYLAYNPDHRWYYVREMRNDQAWVFKNYDSAGNISARFTPHSAFLDRPPNSANPPRQSIEFRAFALFG